MFTLSDRRTCNRPLVIGGGGPGTGLKADVCGARAVVMARMRHDVGTNAPLFRCLAHCDDFEPIDVVGVWPGVLYRADETAVALRELEVQLDLIEERVQAIRDRGAIIDGVITDAKAAAEILHRVLTELG